MACRPRRDDGDEREAASLIAKDDDKSGRFQELGQQQQAATEHAQGYMLSVAVAFAVVGGGLDVSLTHYGLGAVGWLVCTIGVVLLLAVGDLDVDEFLASRPKTITALYFIFIMWSAGYVYSTSVHFAIPLVVGLCVLLLPPTHPPTLHLARRVVVLVPLVALLPA